MKALAVSRRHSAAAPVIVILTLALIGVLYAAIGTASRAEASPAQISDDATIIAGHRLFVEGCSSCHGVGAQGGPSAPTLIGVGSAAVDFQLTTGRMPLATPQVQAQAKNSSYSADEIAQIAAYIQSLAPGPKVPTDAEVDYSDGNIARGGELFRTNCSQCHNFQGQGGALSDGAYAPNLRDATPHIIYEAMLTGPENMPVFSNTTMTTKDKQDIIAFIQNFDDSASYGGWDIGALGPVSEGLFIWIAGIGAFIGVAIWIGAKVR